MSNKLNETFQKHMGYLKTKLNGNQLNEIDFAPAFKKEEPKDSAVILHADGRETPIEPKNGTDFSTQELNQIVGGHFELVYLHLPNNTTILMVVNEEGKLKQLPVNTEATVIFTKTTHRKDVIRGDVLICRMDQIQ